MKIAVKFVIQASCVLTHNFLKKNIDGIGCSNEDNEGYNDDDEGYNYDEEGYKDNEDEENCGRYDRDFAKDFNLW